MLHGVCGLHLDDMSAQQGTNAPIVNSGEIGSNDTPMPVPATGELIDQDTHSIADLSAAPPEPRNPTYTPKPALQETPVVLRRSLRNIQ